MKQLFSYFSSFAPDNASGMDRYWTGNGPAVPRKMLAILFCLFFVGVGQVWGAVATLTFSSTPSNNKVYTDGHSKSWTLTSDNAGYWALDGSTTIHAGSGSKSVSHITFTSGGYHGETITKITITGYGKNVGAYATINGSNFGTQNQTATSSGTRTFTGTTTVGNSGNVVVKLKRNSASKDAIYCSQIQVFYYTTITLDKNGGLEDGDIKFDHDAANCVASSFHAVTRDGYTCTGYWTAASGGTKILNDDGSLAGASITVDDVPYTSSATKWAYTGGTLTLYAQWESAVACANDPTVSGSGNGSFFRYHKISHGKVGKVGKLTYFSSSLFSYYISISMSVSILF